MFFSTLNRVKNYAGLAMWAVSFWAAAQTPPAAPISYVSVTAGACHTCALTSDGSAMCWGNNGMSQLGLSDFVDREALPGCLTTPIAQEAAGQTRQTTGIRIAPVPRPVMVKGLVNAKSLHAGNEHTCAIQADNTVACWGIDAANKANLLPTTTSTPTPVKDLGAVQTMSAGTFHSCAVTSDERVACWSIHACQAACGETKQPDGAFANHALTLTDLQGVAGIAVGRTHACAFNLAGNAACWGDNDEGQLSVDTRLKYSYRAKGVTGLGKVLGMASKEDHTCALQAGGVVSCWGHNSSAELGDGLDNLTRPKKRHMPMPVVGLPKPAIAIAAGSEHYCALLADKTVACWGNNRLGQLGSSGPKLSSQPLLVSGLTNVTALSLGANHSCALKTDSSIVCWGSNTHGQLGNGTLQDSSTPIAVLR
jgi:alpha-tubulin suppressor-like RCC1 family protein